MGKEDKKKLLEDQIRGSQIGSPVYEHARNRLAIQCAEDIEASIDGLKNQLVENAKTADRLTAKVYWLNVILAAATVVGAIATAVIAFKTP